MVQCFLERKYYDRFRENKTELLYISRVKEEDFVHPRVMHAHEDFAEIILVREGTGSFIINGKPYEVNKGDLILLNSGVVHDEHSNMLSHYGCAVTGVLREGLRKNAIIEDGEIPVIHTGELFGAIDGILGQMFYLLCGNIPKAEECCGYLLEVLMAQIGLVLNEPLKKVEEVRSERMMLAEQIRDYIDHNYMNDITLGTISNELHISLFYLSHTFKEFFGYSPMQYMLRRRIGEAQSLLIGTDFTVTRIAMLVGYDNPNHFNTIFSKNVGLSPRNYRLSYREKEKEDLSYTVL